MADSTSEGETDPDPGQDYSDLASTAIPGEVIIIILVMNDVGII